MRHWLARLWQAMHGQQPPAPIAETEMPIEVLPQDWTAVGNALRQVLGLSPWDGPPRYPTIEELESWDRAFPRQDMVKRLRQFARKEAEHRVFVDRYSSSPPRQRQGRR